MEKATMVEYAQKTPAVAPSVALRANSVAMCNEICAPCQASPPPPSEISS